MGTNNTIPIEVLKILQAKQEKNNKNFNPWDNTPKESKLKSYDELTTTGFDVKLSEKVVRYVDIRTLSFKVDMDILFKLKEDKLLKTFYESLTAELDTFINTEYQKEIKPVIKEEFNRLSGVKPELTTGLPLTKNKFDKLVTAKGIIPPPMNLLINDETVGDKVFRVYYTVIDFDPDGVPAGFEILTKDIPLEFKDEFVEKFGEDELKITNEDIENFLQDCKPKMVINDGVTDNVTDGANPKTNETFSVHYFNLIHSPEVPNILTREVPMRLHSKYMELVRNAEFSFTEEYINKFINEN